MRSRMILFLKGIFDLRDGKEKEEKIIENIQKDVEFKGENLLTLIFAIFIASVGLNINSTAIIIGAMLISPLMGPIIGVGLSLGINDNLFLRKSIISLLIATIIGIVISTLYFYVSPISNIQSELLARTSPTIYDVIIAFFGGLAGIVASTRIKKGNVVPGVAIATALMPPLCTVGYGIATGQPDFFLGAFYLYTINCIFICLATILGVKYMRIPKVAYDDKKQLLRTRIAATIVVIAMLVPATYFAYVFVEENNFNLSAEKFLQDNFSSKGHTVIYKNINYKSSPRSIEVAFLSKHFNEEEISDLKNRLRDYNLIDTKLMIMQDDISLTEEQWNNAIANMQNESEKIKALEQKLSKSYVTSDSLSQILSEAKIINNKINKISIGNMPSSGDSLIEGGELPIALIYSASSTESFTDDEKEILSRWLMSRVKNHSLLVYFNSSNL